MAAPRGLSSRYLSQIQSGIIPDPADLSPDEQQHLISQPWFQKALDLHSAGVTPTPEMIQKLMVQPGSQGFKFQAIDPQDESKGHILVDLASGKTVPHTDIIRPDFKPQLVPQKDENGKITGYGMTTSASSAVPWKGGEKGPNPLMDTIKPGQASPVYADGKLATFLVNDGQKIQHITPYDPIKGMLMGDPNSPAQPPGPSAPAGAPAPAATPAPTPSPGFSTGAVTIGNPNAVPAPAPAAPAAAPAADFESTYNSLPAGASYTDPTGTVRIKGGGR